MIDTHHPTASAALDAETRFWAAVGGVALVVCILGAKAFHTDGREVDMIRTAETVGVHAVRLGRRALFECPRDQDRYAREFHALGPAGEEVRGVVCCGETTGCSVRL